MNLESTYSYDKVIYSRYFQLLVVLGDKKFIHQRKVYDFMDFFGDAGGIYESMMLLGTVIHFCIS